MQTKIKMIVDDALKQINSATTIDEIEKIRVATLGKKGALTTMFKEMGKLTPDEKKEMGRITNTAKQQIEGAIAESSAKVKEEMMNKMFIAEWIDVTEPGKEFLLGGKHPITLVIDEISDVFMAQGFSIAEGPEIETVFNNFDALNADPHHPARDMTDTFYISENILLRTQTSPVQIRALIANEPPIKIISPGRCFRCDTPDATHSPMFHQVEGLLIDEGVTMADLKGALDDFAKKLFGESVKTKFRPHHFPFTEPSAEMDVSCFKCGGSGCRVCKGGGWIEILGCGMVHPNVLKVGGIDTERYTGFAFGMGVERIAMLKYGVDDIRLFYENDMRFINQFK